MVLLSPRDMTQSDHEMQGNPDREAGTESRSTGFHPHGSTPPTDEKGDIMSSDPEAVKSNQGDNKS